MIRAKTNNLVKREGIDSDEEVYVEENLGSDYAQGLIEGVVGGLREHQYAKQRRRLPRQRLQ